MLCPHLTVAANLFLGDEISRFGLLRSGAMIREGQKLLDDLGFDLPAGARALQPDHRPAAARRHRARRTARREIPDLRRADRLSHPARSRRAVHADPPAEGERRHHRLHQPSPRRSVRTRRPRVDPARRRADLDQAHCRHQRGRPDRRHDQPLDRADLSQGQSCRSATSDRDEGPDRQGLPRRLDRRPRRRNRRALRPHRRRSQRIRAERVRALPRDRRPILSGRASPSPSAASAKR